MPSIRLFLASSAAVVLAAGVATVATFGLRSPSGIDWNAELIWPAALSRLFGPAPPRPARPEAGDQLSRLPPELAAALVAPRLDAPSPFIRLTRIKPETVCKQLERDGLKGSQFQKHEPPMRGWSCVADLITPVAGDEMKVSSLFVSMRGQESDRIETIRIKLNLIDPATAAPTRTLARALLVSLCRGLGWDPPAGVVQALDTLKEGDIIDRGVSYDLRREFGELPRYNFILSFPRTLGAGGEDRFVTDPRHQAVAR